MMKEEEIKKDKHNNDNKNFIIIIIIILKFCPPQQRQQPTPTSPFQKENIIRRTLGCNLWSFCVILIAISFCWSHVSLLVSFY